MDLQNGLPPVSTPGVYVNAYISPDGRYLAETDGTRLATFDLTDRGRRLAQVQVDGREFRNDASVWTGDHEIILTDDPAMKDSGKPGVTSFPKTGHSPVYRVLGPDLKVIEETQFVLPDDPRGYCSSWPITWAPKTQFPGAFVP